MVMMTLFVVSANAQKYYRSTGDRVIVRSGPGKNYRQIKDEGWLQPVYLGKGEIVSFEGAKRNGFVKIGSMSLKMFWTGWASAQYLTPAVKCQACNGRGTTGRVCPECNGEGLAYCCNYTGRELCNQCGGIGWK